MTVRELIELLKKFDGNAKVYIDCLGIYQEAKKITDLSSIFGKGILIKGEMK